MKLFNKLLIVFFCISVLTSCDPNLVDAPPLSDTENTYFSNADQFRAQLASVYAVLYGYYHYAAPEFNGGGWVTGTWLLPGDDLTESDGARTSVELFDGSLNAQNTQTGFVFSSSYKMIGRAHVALDKLSEVDFSNFDGAEEIARMEGEALFLRAWAYYRLFNTFGSVPLITKRLSSEETNTPKSSTMDILSQVIDDARNAIEFLPEIWEDGYEGRATKNSARGLLAKALVFRGNYSGDMEDYQEALNVFNSITANLVPNFIDNFNAATENNQESLFEVQAAIAAAGSNLFLHNDGAWRGVENLTVFRGYMMEFRNSGDFNDASSTKFLITDKLYNRFGDDPRISVHLNPDDGYEGRIFQKYNKPDGVNNINNFNNHGGSTNNERVLRYADLVLITAEAALKTGDSDTAINLINQVRTRARSWAESTGYGDGATPADHPTGETNEATIMQWIMDERYVELAGEGQRWYDLKRWHESGDIDLSGWDGSEENFSTALESQVQFDVNKHLVFPIPQSEIEANDEITENNPGY